MHRLPRVFAMRDCGSVRLKFPFSPPPKAARTMPRRESGSRQVYLAPSFVDGCFGAARDPRPRPPPAMDFSRLSSKRVTMLMRGIIQWVLRF